METMYSVILTVTLVIQKVIVAIQLVIALCTVQFKLKILNLIKNQMVKIETFKAT